MRAHVSLFGSGGDWLPPGGGGGGGIAAVGAPVSDMSGNFGTQCIMSVSPGGGSNRAIIVLVAWQTHGALPSSVVFNTSENFTLIGSHTTIASESLAAYYLLNPSNVTADVVVTFGGTGFSTAVAQCLTGVDQTTPVAGWTTVSDQAGSNPSQTIGSVAAGEWVFDVISISDADAAGTAGTGQSLLVSDGRGQASGAGGIGSSYIDDETGSVSCDWTPGFVVNWSGGIFRVSPAA